MSGDSAHRPCVLVVDLALYDPAPERPVIFGWRYGGKPFLRRSESHALKTQRFKYVPGAKLVERLAGNAFKRFTKQNEADIAVFRSSAGIGGKWHCVGLP